MKKYKHIIWDWNGTLLNDIDCCIQIANQLLENHPGELINKETYKANFGFPIKDYYQQVGFNFQIESFESLCDQFITAYKKALTECRLHQGAKQLIEEIEDHNINQSVLSAAEQELLNNMVHQFGLNDYFKQVSGLSNNLANSKVENGLKLVQKLALSPGEYLVIGDTRHDLDVAEAIGADCLLVAHGHQSYEKLKTHHHSVLEDLEEVIDFIKT